MFSFYCHSFNILYYCIHIGIFKYIFQFSAHLIVTELKNEIIRAIVVVGVQDFSLPKVT